MKVGWRAVRLGLVLAATLGIAHAEPETPVGLVLSATNLSLLRVGFNLPLTARPGDILFAGDKLISPSSPSAPSMSGSGRFLFCPDPKIHEMGSAAEVVFDARQLRVRGGALGASVASGGCSLPMMERFVATTREDGGIDYPSDSSGTFEQRVAKLAAADRQTLVAEIDRIDRELAVRNDPVLHLARAQAFEQRNLFFDAAEEMRTVVSLWPDAGWARSRLFDLGSRGAVAIPRSTGPDEADSGKNVFALLIGISSFENDQIRPLQFAHADAADMEKMLMSPAGGTVPKANIKTLINRAATFRAIAAAIDTHLRNRGPNDTVLLFIASHGTVIGDRGYIVASDTNPEDLASTAIDMEDIRQLFLTELAHVRRLVVFVDVCHAGKIGQIVPNILLTNQVTQRLETGEHLFGMLAAQKKQAAVEGINYGGGHGAFSFFLMKALNGDADDNNDHRITTDELARYVEKKVSDSTGSHQIPKVIGDQDEHWVMAYPSLPGIALADYAAPVLVATRERSLEGSDKAAPESEGESRQEKYDREVAVQMEAFDQAIREGRILPAQNNGAFEILGVLKRRLSLPDYLAAAEKLKVALENQGQNLLNRYLAGEQNPPQQPDFLAGGQYFEAAQTLARDSVFLEAHKAFCEGRVKLFNRDFAGAATELERAIRLDPSRAYSYNALGIAFLEQADFDRAILAFRDAVHRAPYWAYPLHNMALAFTQKGDFASAISAYQEAIRLAPQYAYLQYNLGLLYQRLNRRKEAEGAYQNAAGLSPHMAEVYNALGYLRETQGRKSDAETLYKRALDENAGLAAARQNLAVLLSGQPARAGEAISLWRTNLSKQSDYLPSRLSLAKALEASGNTDEAIAEYRTAADARPDYVAVHLALAGLYRQKKLYDEALIELLAALRLQPANPVILEQTGDLEAARGHAAQARAAYQQALSTASDRAMRKRVQSKIKAL